MPKQDTLEASIKRERARLQKARDKAAEKKATAEQELAAIDEELAAIAAYEKAKGANGQRPARRVMRRKGGRRGEKRAAVLDKVNQHPGGLSRGEILDLMGVKGNKAAEQSVSNALSALTKQNQLGKRDGKYVPA